MIMGELIASNEGVAQSAVSSISKVSILKGKKTSLSQSTVPSMKTGVEVSNQLLSNLEELVKSVQTQADKFPQLAKVMAERDRQQTFNAGGK